MPAPIVQRMAAEAMGTGWLVLGGCGSAVLAATVPHGIGLAGVALAFGLTVLTGAYAFGHISGGHFNPAVTVGLWTAGRIKGGDVAPYIGAQLIGAFLGALVVLGLAMGDPAYNLAAQGLAQNGYGAGSPRGYSMAAALLSETVMTFVFVIVILGATDSRASPRFAPIAIGFALTLIHLVSIPVTNTSVNPARSTAPALLVGGLALQQLWLFWLAPLIGAVAAGAIHAWAFASAPDVAPGIPNSDGE